MFKKVIAIMTMAFLVVPAVADAAGTSGADTTTTCVPIPVTTDAKDVHIGDKHLHLPGRSDIRVCTTVDPRATGTPTVTRYENCGGSCFAVRVSGVRAYADVSVELTYKEDGQPRRIPVDPDPVDLTRDVEEVCISNHSGESADPCVMTLQSPSDLKAKGGDDQVALRWSPARETYGRDIAPVYEVWRSTEEDLETFEHVATSESTRFVDIALESNTTYWYYVVAVDQDGNRSGGSNMATATTK